VSQQISFEEFVKYGVPEEAPGLGQGPGLGQEQPAGIPSFQPKEGSKLSLILVDMLKAAWRKPGKPQRRELASGLRIELILGLEGVLRMQISREKVYPADKEWETIAEHWPQAWDWPMEGGHGIAVPLRAQEMFTAKGRRYLRGEWPV